MAKKLCRSRTERMIAGVCGGLAEYFEIDPTLVRLIAVALTLAGGSGILAYFIFWFVVPQRPLNLASVDNPAVASSITETEDIESKESNEASSAALFVGVILTVLGFLFLVGNFISFAWFSFSKLWPLVLIAVGIVVILKGTGSKQHES
jgi:phage shock protein C